MHNRKVTGLIACDPRGVMALNHRLPWDYPEDAAFFRTTTKNQIIILGHTTFLELSPSFIEQRYCIVFSNVTHLPHVTGHVVYVSSMAAFEQLDCIPSDRSCYMIGGAQVARLFLENNRLDDLLLTEIITSYPGDSFFPLEWIAKWPVTCLKKTVDFSINHYVNPRSIYTR